MKSPIYTTITKEERSSQFDRLSFETHKFSHFKLMCNLVSSQAFIVSNHVENPIFLILNYKIITFYLKKEKLKCI